LVFVSSLQTIAAVEKTNAGRAIVCRIQDPLPRAARLLLEENNDPWFPVSEIAAEVELPVDVLMQTLTLRRDGLALPVFRWNGAGFDAVSGMAIDSNGIKVHAEVIETLSGYFSCAGGLLRRLRHAGRVGFGEWVAKADDVVRESVGNFVFESVFYGRRFARLATATIGRIALKTFEEITVEDGVRNGEKVEVEIGDLIVCRGSRNAERKKVRPGDRIVALAGTVPFGTLGSVVEVGDHYGRMKIWAIADKEIQYGTTLNGRLSTSRGFSLMEDEVEILTLESN
jgi:hypothetical protein